ncbi:MAG TPA: YqgE/AlgH family protein [Planctomycetes bacterium]|nr:YqgE/AlgH family protein [Planctomycetota bacterium]
MTDELLLEPGTLLAAWPDLMDPNFMHTVLVLCRHTEEGAFGFVTNRRTEFTVADLLPDHELLAHSSFPVHLGGPVDHSTLQFLHTLPDRIPGGVQVTGELMLGGDLDALARALDELGDDAGARVRLLLGYSGWGAGQLEGELRSGSWIPAPHTPSAIFGPEGEDQWRRVVRSSGVVGEDLGNQPPDVSWN